MIVLRQTLRWWCILLVVAAIGFGLYGCSGGTEEKVKLTAPWQDGDVSRYAVKQDGIKVADWEMAVNRVDGQWVFISDQQATNHEHVEVFADIETFVPTKTEYRLEGDEVLATYTAEYSADSVDIQAETPQGPQQVTIKLPAPPYFDNEQFVMIIRAMPLAEGWSGKFPVIVTRSGQKAELTVKVVGTEDVSVPAGEFTAFKIALKGTGQYGWINTEQPHQLLKWENTRAGTVSELVEYTEN